jgi:hypothetical protein
VAPYINISNSFAFTFIIIILISSNIWTGVYAIILSTINTLWPKISFKNNQKLIWLWQTLFGGAIFAIVVWMLIGFSTFIFKAVQLIIKK